MTPEGGFKFLVRKFIKHFRKLRELFSQRGMYVYACTFILIKKNDHYVLQKTNRTVIEIP